MPTSNSNEDPGGTGLPEPGDPAVGPRGPLHRLAVGLKWLGAAAVVAGVAAFPMVIWFSGPWAVLALLLVMGGCVLLVAALRMQRAPAPPERGLEPGGDPGAG